MPREITIDASGRLVVPKDVRDRHHLAPGSRLVLIERDDGILLARSQEPRLVERAGLLVVSGEASDQLFDHRDLREAHLDRVERAG